MSSVKKKETTEARPRRANLSLAVPAPVVVPGQVETLVVAGNGMAGHRFCQQLLQGGGAARYRILVFGEEPTAAYDRVNLTAYLRSGDPEKLVLSPARWYDREGIELYLKARIHSIDRERQSILTESGHAVHYDRLVLATGSLPYVPPVEGIDLPGVFVYRTFQDLDAIRKHCKNASQGIVLGGGLLGIEAAKALRELGIGAHIVERRSGLMSRQLDARASGVLQDILERMGLRVHLDLAVRKIGRRGEQLVVTFENGMELTGDLVIVSTGVRPRDELAKTAGLSVGIHGGILVDDGLCTSDPNIFAIGECVLHRGSAYGLVAPAYAMADSLAASFLGQPRPFTGADQSATLKISGTQVASLGDTEEGAGKAHVFASAGIYRKLFTDGGRIRGYISVGAAIEMAPIREAIRSRKRVWPWEIRAFMETGLLCLGGNPGGGVRDWPETAIVCSCKSITRGQLETAIKEGAAARDQLCLRTGAGTSCGSCTPLLDALLGPARTNAGPKRSGGALLMIASLVIPIVAVAVFWELPEAGSAQGPLHVLNSYLDDRATKKITGFLIAGSLLSSVLLLSLRARWKRFRVWEFGRWRSLHAYVSVAGLAGLAAHTGFRLDSPLNVSLFSLFALTSLTGAATGIVTAVETFDRGALSLLARAHRKQVAAIHRMLLAPLLVLLAFHILGAFFF